MCVFLPIGIAIFVAGYLKEGDLEGLVSVWHPECQIYLGDQAPPLLGIDGVRAVVKDSIPLRPTLKSTLQAKTNGGTALLEGSWRVVA